jgi:competence protein ComEA
MRAYAFFRQEASMFPVVLVALALVVLHAPVVRASERIEKPALHSSAPSRVDAPPARSDKTRVAAPASEKTQTASTAKVNVNTADVKSLMTLTGVGRKVAEKIVEYRDSHGPFKKADDIRKVEGVGNGVWERNRERIVVK